MTAKDVRWQQRLENFDRALALLEEAFLRPPDQLSALEKEGAIQRFEFTFELAWKTLKDYLEHSGLTIQPATPRECLKVGYSAGILANGDEWLAMLDLRNGLSHVYDAARFEVALATIRTTSLPDLRQLHQWLLAQRDVA